jgi:hypothetical protein
LRLGVVLSKLEAKFGCCGAVRKLLMGRKLVSAKLSRHSAGDEEMESKTERDKASSKRATSDSRPAAPPYKAVGSRKFCAEAFVWSRGLERSGLFRRTEPGGSPVQAWRVGLPMATRDCKAYLVSRRWGGRWKSRAVRVESGELKEVWESAGVCEKAGSLRRRPHCLTKAGELGPMGPITRGQRGSPKE